MVCIAHTYSFTRYEVGYRLWIKIRSHSLNNLSFAARNRAI
ncbi:Uncharacterised protein [Vibrio cholerae]|nr:Uncharacterised protein [Vibrio cholerae]CSI94988.1 Uncharacterised protein [Vibrio cholerae]